MIDLRAESVQTTTTQDIGKIAAAIAANKALSVESDDASDTLIAADASSWIDSVVEETPAPATPSAPQWVPTFKVLADRKALLAAIKRVAPAIPKKEVKPILKNLKAIANGKLTLQATDLEVGIRLDVNVQVQTAGESILPAKGLADILKNATDEDTVAIQADNFQCKVYGDRMEMEMPGEDPALFPDIPAFAATEYHEINAGQLKEMIRRTVFACADGESARYAMTGVLWELDGDSVRLVATDGRRLSLAEDKAQQVGDHTTKGRVKTIVVRERVVNEDGDEITPEKTEQRPDPALVPGKTMELLEKNILTDRKGNASGVVKVCFRPNEVLFQTEDCTIYSRLVDGRFPDYRQVFPSPHKQKATAKLDADTFLKAVKSAATMTDDASLRVTFTFGDGKVELTAKGSNSGKSSTAVRCEYDPMLKPISINFNPWYIIEYLKTLPKKATVEIDLIDGKTPALLRSGDGFKYLIMPLT